MGSYHRVVPINGVISPVVCGCAKAPELGEISTCSVREIRGVNELRPSGWRVKSEARIGGSGFAAQDLRVPSPSEVY